MTYQKSFLRKYRFRVIQRLIEEKELMRRYDSDKPENHNAEKILEAEFGRGR